MAYQCLRYLHLLHARVGRHVGSKHWLFIVYQVATQATAEIYFGNAIVKRVVGRVHGVIKILHTAVWMQTLPRIDTNVAFACFQNLHKRI